MEFKQAIRRGFEGYIDIHTRATRQEFWLWWVFVVLSQCCGQRSECGFVAVGRVAGLVPAYLDAFYSAST